MPVVYKLGDIFCLTSQGPGETWGLAVNEAMACGKAVIVSDRCGCATDLVKSGNNGFIFEYNNIADLTEKIQYFIDHKAEIGKMGQAGLDIIQNWSFLSIVTAIEATV